MINKRRFIATAGFTLVELLVVISIIGILASIGLVAFRSAQFRSRDAERKSDLKELSNALELFYSDYGKYPSSSGGQLLACGYNSLTGIGTACTWGEGEFRDTYGGGNTKTTYFKVLPKDEISEHTYYYRTVAVNSVADSGFQIYAYLENSQDQSIISTDVLCGTNLNCNFAITSSNTTPFE
jgi:prepilin-type N-terminal cleavage/methylation domain-containing protein